MRFWNKKSHKKEKGGMGQIFNKKEKCWINVEASSCKIHGVAFCYG